MRSYKKSLLGPQNRVKGLQWARKYRNWSVEEWKNVLWTDEFKFEGVWLQAASLCFWKT